MPKSRFRNVYLLGFLSLFNDVASEAIAPLLPIYLASLGWGAAFLGIMEGLANFLSYLTMLFSGIFADRFGQNKKITLLGYRLCAWLRPLYAIPHPILILFIRIFDRVGKGIRTAPRDRLITTSVAKHEWGKAFGIHRSMDHLGSVMGASLAALFLAYFSKNFSILFLLVSLPAIASILIIPRLIEDIPGKLKSRPTRLSWDLLPKKLRPYILVIFISALSTPSELFLMLKLQDLGMPAYQIPLAWMFLTLFKLSAAYLGGYLADQWSRRATLAVGWLFFALAYVFFAFNTSLFFGWLLIGLYGFHAGIVEPSERAYPATVADEEGRATALGWFYFAYGIGLLPASLIFGFIWKVWGSHLAFLIFAGMTLLTVPLLALLPSDKDLRKSGG